MNAAPLPAVARPRHSRQFLAVKREMQDLFGTAPRPTHGVCEHPNIVEETAGSMTYGPDGPDDDIVTRHICMTCFQYVDDGPVEQELPY